MAGGAGPGEEPSVRMAGAIPLPIGAERLEGGLRQEGIAILVPFPALNEDTHRRRINVGGLHRGRFADAKPGAIRERQPGAMLEIGRLRQERTDVRTTQHHGQCRRQLLTGNLKIVQRAIQSNREEEPNRGAVDSDGSWRQLLVANQEHQESANVVGVERVHRPRGPRQEQSHVSQIAGDRMRRELA